MVPAVVEHFAGYADPDQRALMVREHPVGLALDLEGAAGAARAVGRGAGAAVPGVVAAAKSPVLRTAAGLGADLATGGRFSSLRAARQIA
jgi:hypothetical protein